MKFLNIKKLPNRTRIETIRLKLIIIKLHLWTIRAKYFFRDRRYYIEESQQPFINKTTRRKYFKRKRLWTKDISIDVEEKVLSGNYIIEKRIKGTHIPRFICNDCKQILHENFKCPSCHSRCKECCPYPQT